VRLKGTAHVAQTARYQKRCSRDSQPSAPTATETQKSRWLAHHGSQRWTLLGRLERIDASSRSFNSIQFNTTFETEMMLTLPYFGRIELKDDASGV
jgi:hypothetical protein